MAVDPHSRRRFLRRLSGLTALCMMPRSWALERAAQAAQCESVDSLLAHINDLDAARILGWSYLAKHPAEADQRHLLDRVLGTGLTPWSNPNASALRRHLALQQRQDFQNGATVTVDGWILSRTEARLYALCALG